MRNPTIVIPYTGPNSRGLIDDVFLYLRPETNGIMVESILMNVLRSSSIYRENAELVYLANLPGDFIMENHVVEEHYSVNYQFACAGKELFTDFMKMKFEEKFSEKFDNAKILGSFEVLTELGIEPEDLFNIWVSEQDMMLINGQSIKKYKNIYIINYDLPALLHKNNFTTDIAVMILRSTLKKDQFLGMIRDMEFALINNGIMDKNKPPSRFFHYSKGPFEQILDGRGYLYNEDGTHISDEKISFTEKLLQSGFSLEDINNVITNPIMTFDMKDGVIEDNIFTRTKSNTFDEALDVLKSVRCQIYFT